MKKLLGALALLMSLVAPAAQAAESSVPLETAPYRLNDLAALQNGARIFVNHCLNCHSANSVRYSDLHQIGLSDDQIANNLLFTGATVNDMMNIPMSPEDAKAWFGTAPPDLSVIARAKSVNAGPPGGDYIYTYMRSFYRDASKLTGWDNLLFPSVAMPHVMWELEGPRELIKTTTRQTADGSWERLVTTYDKDGYASTKTEPATGVVAHGGTTYAFKPLDPAQARAFDNQMADLAAFMTWMGEPVQVDRKRIGMWVLFYLALFLLIAWRLNAVYWRDVK